MGRPERPFGRYRVFDPAVECRMYPEVEGTPTFVTICVLELL